VKYDGAVSERGRPFFFSVQEFRAVKSMFVHICGSRVEVAERNLRKKVVMPRVERRFGPMRSRILNRLYGRKLTVTKVRTVERFSWVTSTKAGSYWK
jgi:hypothetical protein